MTKDNVSILHKLYHRRLTGRATEGLGSREKELRLCEPRHPWYYVPLKSIIDQHQALLRGHVLLGFLKDGIHLISYLCLVESSLTDIFISQYTYSLFIWRFDLGAPLTKVCSYALFEGEMINSDLQLVICESPESDRIVILGVGMHEEETCRQCYVSIVPPPDTLRHALQDQSRDVFFIHFKYDLQPPYPAFTPLLSLKLKDTIICNTGDSLTTYTVQSHHVGTDYICNTPSSTISSTPGSVSSNDNVDNNNESTLRKRTKYVCSCPFLRSMDHLSTCVVGRMETVHVASECDIFSPVIPSKRKRYTSKKITSPSPRIASDKKNGEIEAVTTYSCRMYGLAHLEPSSHKIRYDATHALYPTRVASQTHGPLRVTYTDVQDDGQSFKPALQDDFVSVTQVSFDAERYINNAVHQYHQLAARYVSLKDYDMRLIDVCEDTNSIIILITVLCYAAHKTNQHRQVLVSSGFLLSWNIDSGNAQTLDFLPIEEFADNPCPTRPWNGSAHLALSLRKKWFIPTSFPRTVRAFSNSSVFSGTSLTKLQHPYLPVAIIL